MLRWSFGVVLLLHGLIHFIGLANAIPHAQAIPLRHAVSPTFAVPWSTVAVLLAVAAVMYVSQSAYWWIAAGPGIALSQTMIWVWRGYQPPAM